MTEEEFCSSGTLIQQFAHYLVYEYKAKDDENIMLNSTICSLFGL